MSNIFIKKYNINNNKYVIKKLKNKQNSLGYNKNFPPANSE